MTIHIFLISVVSACIEPFEPDVSRNDELLVVEGHVSDKPEPYTVRLSLTQPLDSLGSQAASGAQVVVVDQEGAEHYFEEKQAGIYQSDPECFIGKKGCAYTLTVETSTGARYQSDPVILKTTPDIDSVYYERDQRLTAVEGEVQDGVRILVDTHDDEGKARRYRYEWIETYEIKVPYPQHISVWKCYNTIASKDILLANTSSLQNDQVSQFELNYVTTEDYELRSVYSVLVRQFALDEKGYTYWNELQKNSETLGTLFDPMPYSLTGNVKSIENPNEPVLGYFDASTVVEKRLYIQRGELSDLNYPSDECFWNLITVVDGSPPFGYCLASLGSPGGSSPNIFAPSYCCDCTKYGTLTVPEFWEY